MNTRVGCVASAAPSMIILRCSSVASLARSSRQCSRPISANRALSVARRSLFRRAAPNMAPVSMFSRTDSESNTWAIW